jgi:glycosyltransferase involved in cell wall biosynthesis
MGPIRGYGILKQAARGVFVAFLDDDDEWLPGKLRKQMALFYMVPDHVGSIDTGFMEIDERKGTTREVKPGLKGWIFEDLLVKSRGRAPKLSSMVVRTAVLREAGGFDSELPSRQDLDLYLRMARICSFENIEEPLVCKYIHLGERITSSTSKKLEGFDRLYVKYQSDLLQRPEIHRVYLKRHAYWMLRGGHPVSAVCKYLQGMMVR